jgi:hypothetical protein
MTPSGLQPPVEASFMDYFTLKIETIGGNKVIVPTYGSPNEKITAICEYGKKSFEKNNGKIHFKIDYF